MKMRDASFSHFHISHISTFITFLNFICMKFIYLAVLASTLLYACHRKLSASASPIYNTSTYVDTKGDPMLLGTHPAKDLEQPPYGDWFNKNYADYTIDTATASQLAPLLKDKTFELFLGTWCGDSKREIPRMLKILRYAGVQPSQIKLIMVDTHDSLYKQSPAHEEKGKNIFRVPDLLVYSGGRETNRIVEHPVTSLEKDLLLIARGDAYMPAYPGAAYLIHLLQQRTAAELMADKDSVVALLKPVVKSSADLNSLGYVWMGSAGEENKAVLALQLNAMLYPGVANVYDSLGDFYRKMKRKEDAQKYYRKALEMAPGNTRTAEKLAQLN